MASPAPLAAIVGPTGSGKSELAMALARQLPIEILVADSRQVYRGMAIGTAAPNAADRAAVPHHLLDLVKPGEPFSVADWVVAARRARAEVAARGRLPVLVGGTGLYVAALVDGYALGGGPSDDGSRAQIAEDLASLGVAALAQRLARADPETAARIDLRNPRRVTRALERLTSTGSASPAAPSTWAGPLAMFGLDRPREVLHRRIDERAAWLFANGLLDEVRALLEAGHDPRRSPLTSHGFGEAARHLAGEWSLEQAIEVTARRTRQHAKRQMTWFRRDRRVVWIAAGDEPGDAAAILEEGYRLLNTLGGVPPA